MVLSLVNEDTVQSGVEVTLGNALTLFSTTGLSKCRVGLLPLTVLTGAGIFVTLEFDLSPPKLNDGIAFDDIGRATSGRSGTSTISSSSLEAE